MTRIPSDAPEGLGPSREVTSTRPPTPLWGRHFGSGPTEAMILDQVRSAPFAGAAAAAQLVPIPRNPQRCDYFARAAFRVLEGSRTLCRLVVGKNLTDLHQRSIAIAQACPSIICRPLGWHQHDGWDYLAIEFFEGENLETLVLDGRLSSDAALAHAAKVVAALAQTAQPSTPDAASQELSQLFDRVCGLPLFDGFDQTFLDNLVFPSLRAGVLSIPSTTRWTNGDLIPRNIIVDTAGDLRLIDYEFAERTHFFAADAWRWRSFSLLPPEAKELPHLSDELPARPWLEAVFLFRQMAHQYQINGAHIAVEDSRQAVERLIAFTARANAGFRTSAFFRPLALTAAPAPVRPAGAVAQLYWSHDGSYVETQSQRLEYSPDNDATLRFFVHQVAGILRLRLDPAEAPGLLTLSAIRVRHTQSRQTLLSLNESNGWQNLQFESGLLRLRGSGVLNLLCLNRDPHFDLPEIDAGEIAGDLACEVWLRLSSDLDGVPPLMP